MRISEEYVSICKKIDKELEIPLIQEIFIPERKSWKKGMRKSNFGAVALDDGSVGVVYVNLSKEVKKIAEDLDLSEFHGKKPIKIAQFFTETNPLKKTIGLGAINAISQFLFKAAIFEFDYTTDSMGLLNITPEDKVGMVGFFPPLVKKTERVGSDLIIIEKKEFLVRKTENWEITLDANRLKACNKILITSTTVLNESIDDVLRYCDSAEKVSLIGPTAGFLPDPLFSRGIDIIGGSQVVNTNLFFTRIREGIRWGDSVEKYCIQSEVYSGYQDLIKSLN